MHAEAGCLGADTRYKIYPRVQAQTRRLMADWLRVQRVSYTGDLGYERNLLRID